MLSSISNPTSIKSNRDNLFVTFTIFEKLFLGKQVYIKIFQIFQDGLRWQRQNALIKLRLLRL